MKTSIEIGIEAMKDFNAGMKDFNAAIEKATKIINSFWWPSNWMLGLHKKKHNWKKRRHKARKGYKRHAK